MTRTFKSEDNRKDQLFAAWFTSLQDRNVYDWPPSFDEIIECQGELVSRGKKQLTFQLVDGRKIRSVSIDARVSEHLSVGDGFDFIIGRRERTWYILEIHSVVSFFPADRGQTAIHLTVNPLLAAQPETVH